MSGTYLYLLAWSATLAVFVHWTKRAAARWGCRHSPLFEAALPVLAPLLGAATGAAAPRLVGVDALVGDSARSIRWAGLFYGFGAGAASSVALQLALEALPHTSTLRELLKVDGRNGGD